jgi:hypothetical protein
MKIALSIFGVAFTAFCVWLVVRIVNRRERWAKWTAAALMVLVVSYPLSYPWAFSVVFHRCKSQSTALGLLADFYAPFGWAMLHSPEFIQEWYGIYNVWCLRSTGVPLMK